MLVRLTTTATTVDYAAATSVLFPRRFPADHIATSAAAVDHTAADAWIRDGWNVGCFYWNQFADDDDVAGASTTPRAVQLLHCHCNWHWHCNCQRNCNCPVQCYCSTTNATATGTATATANAPATSTANATATSTALLTLTSLRLLCCACHCLF